jgi:hypothetical protein
LVEEVFRKDCYYGSLCDRIADISIKEDLVSASKYITICPRFRCMSSEGKKSMYRLYKKINSIVEHSNEKQRDSVKIISDIDCGIIKVYGQDADILKRASSALHELLELSYSAAEHHPYWSILYNATEILKMTIERWESDLSKDEINDVSWRIDEMRTAIDKIALT